MAHSNVPKFGNWENQGNDVPYTVCFDMARKNKGQKMINPNDPQENPDMFRNFAPSPSPPAPMSASASKPRTRPDKPVGMGAVGPTPNRRMSREEGDYRKVTNSPARNEMLGQKTVNEWTQQNYGGRGMRYGRPARSSAGSEYSIDRSPLNPHYQAKIVEGGSGSPAQEGKSSCNSSHGNTGRSRQKPTRGVESPGRGAAVPRFGEWNMNDPQSAEAKIVEGGSGSPAREGKSSYNSSHGNTGRSRQKPTRGVESPGRGAAVPRFGEWNVNDPQSAEDFSGIFNKLWEEKHPGPGIVSTTPKRPSYVAQNQLSKEKPKKCCFPWW